VLPRPLSELKGAVEGFQKNYEMFAKHNERYLLVQDEFGNAFDDAENKTDYKKAAEMFRVSLVVTMNTIEKRQASNKNKWTGKLGTFLQKLYPLARISLSFASTIADVKTFPSLINHKCASFTPLKAAAAGLGIILQVITLVTSNL
jgi:hypothetical protein